MPVRRKRRSGGERVNARPRTVVAMVDSDIPIVEEEHSLLGLPGYYHRMLIECPYHTSGKTRCTKSRNCGPAGTAEFGPMQPAAYLAAWVRRGPEFATREEHMHRQANPDIKAVQETIVSEKWL